MIKAIIFDVGGVLKITDIKATQENIISQFGLSPKLINQSYEKYFSIWQKGQMVESELWRNIINDYVADHQNFQRIVKINQEVYSIAADLKQRGYQTAIMSNVTLEDKALNEKIGLYKPFEIVILSTDIGLNKPDPKIYEITLKKLDVKPQEAIFVDDKKEFIKIAKSLGMHGIVYYNPSQLKQEIEKLIQ